MFIIIFHHPDRLVCDHPQNNGLVRRFFYSVRVQLTACSTVSLSDYPLSDELTARLLCLLNWLPAWPPAWLSEGRVYWGVREECPVATAWTKDLTDWVSEGPTDKQKTNSGKKWNGTQHFCVTQCGWEGAGGEGGGNQKNIFTLFEAN